VTADTLLSSVNVTEGDGSQDFALGSIMELVGGSSPFTEIDQDYYLLAVGPAAGDSERFVGVYHESGGPVFVHGEETAGDTIELSNSGGPVVTFNGTPYSYLTADVTAFRLRGHGAADVIDASLMGAAVPTYQMGGPGDDQLAGGLGADVFVGGAGNDTITGSGSGDGVSYFDSPARAVADFSLSSASEDGWGGVDSLTGLQNLEGTDYHDLLTGNNLNNTIEGRSGGDLINGKDGTDTLYGDAGNDTIYGSNHADTLYGGDGNDKLDGGAANDTLYGGNNNDNMAGGAGSDTLYGDGGSDVMRGNGGHDILYGGDNGDQLFGDAGNDDLFGEGGNDTLSGGGGADELSGGEGDDTLHANAASCTNDRAADSLNGGSENDSATYVEGQDNLTNIESATACTGPRSNQRRLEIRTISNLLISPVIPALWLLPTPRLIAQR
jgi:Ca2+-binding RTX toxin-like protein